MLFENKNVHYPPRLFEAKRLGLFGKGLQQSKKYIQSGRSMIEMLGVLAIVGVLSAGGIAGYSMAMQNYKTNQLIDKMQMIATRVRTTYKGDYSGLNKDKMISSGKLSESDFKNPFGGNINVGRSPSDNDNSFWVFSSDTEEANLPLDTCVDILTTDWGYQAITIQVHNKSGSRIANFTYSPVALSTATTACENEGELVQVQLRFN